MFKTKNSVSLCLCGHRYSYITKILKTDWLLTVLIYNGNRTEWSPILSVIIRVINKIGRPRSGSPICLITSMIIDRIGRHEVMLPINHNYNKICDVLALLKIKNTTNSNSFLACKKTKSHSSARAPWCVLSY